MGPFTKKIDDLLIVFFIKVRKLFWKPWISLLCFWKKMLEGLLLLFEYIGFVLDAFFFLHKSWLFGKQNGHFFFDGRCICIQEEARFKCQPEHMFAGRFPKLIIWAAACMQRGVVGFPAVRKNIGGNVKGRDDLHRGGQNRTKLFVVWTIKWWSVTLA